MASSLELFTARNMDEQNPLPFQYKSDFTGLQLLTTSCFNLGISLDFTENPYVVKFVNQNGDTITVDPEKTIADQGLVKGMTIYVLPDTDNSQLPRTPIRSISQINPDMTILNLPKLRTFTKDANSSNDANNEIVAAKAKATDIASDYGIVLKESGQAVTLLTYDKFNKAENPSCTYYLNYSYEEMCETATRYLNIPNTPNLALLLRFSDIDFKWFEPGHYLEEYSPIENMKFSVFPEKITITVNTIHFPPRDVVVDVKKSVKEIIPEIANKLNLANYECYSLYKIKKLQLDQKELLDETLCLPMQIHNFSELYFARFFYVFTSKDLNSFDSAMFTFRDAQYEFLNGNTYCEESQIVELTAYSLMIDPPNHYEFNEQTDIPSNLIDYIPKMYLATVQTDKDTLVNNIRTKLQTFYQTLTKSSRGEYIRLYLKTVRQIPSFASKVYGASIKSTNSEYIDCHAVFCPQRMFIYFPTDSLVEHEVYYQLITENTLSGRKIQLKFRKHARVFEEISLRSKKAELIHNLLISYSKYFKTLLRERAIENAKKEGSDINSCIIDETNKINLYCYLDRKETPKSQLYPFDWNMRGSSLIPHLVKLLKGNPKSEYKLLLKRSVDDLVWIEPEDTLYNLLVDDEMSLFLIDTKTRIKIHMTDESSKVLFFNPSLLISELVTYTFEKIHLPETPGYTFFTYNVNESNNFQPKALDTNRTIPEQVEEYSDLTFKRRFYILTLNDLIEENVLRQTYFDSKYYLKNGDVDITEEQAFQLAFYTIIIETPKGGSPKSTYESVSFDSLFPRSYKITAKTKSKFDQYFEKSDFTIIPIIAMKKFVILARDLPKFGAETITIQYRDATKTKSKSKRTKFSDGILTACPLLIIISDSQKREVYRIFYQRILSCKVIGNVLFITFPDEKTSESTVLSFKASDITTLFSMISSSMKLIGKLIENGQKERIAQKEADNQRLAGGWVDEHNDVRGKMLDMRLSLDLKVTTNLLRFWIEIDKTKEELLERLYKAGKLDRSKKYSFLLQYNDEYHYLKNGKKIIEFDPLPPRNFILFAIDEEPIIKLTTMFNQIKSMRLNIEKPLSQLIPEIAKKFGLTNYSGYTIFHINEKENRSLKLEQTIPEQVVDYDALYFKRKFFSITNQDYIDISTMRAIFNDVKDHLLSGNVEMTVDEALQLAAYALYVEIRNKPTEKDIPKEIQNLVPKGMSLKATHYKQYKQYCLDITASNEAIAIRKYLKIARDLVSFGSVQFTGVYYEKKKAKKINMYIAPESILIKSQDASKILLHIRNEYLLTIGSAFKTVYLKYIDGDSQIISTFEFECEAASDLIDVHHTYQNINQAILASNIPDVIDESRIMGKNRIEIETGLRFSNTRYLFTYDRRFNGIQLACSACKKLNKNPNGQYSCLLDKQGYRQWVTPTQILGHFFPYNRIQMRFFETNQIITITTYDNVSMKMILDITQPVFKLVPFIADRLYVDNWIGYCLYTQNNKPLDFQKSIPEQTTEFDQLIFKRRIYLATEWDVSSDIISASLFRDFQRKFLTVNSTEFDKNQLIKNSIFIYYAINENTQMAQKMQITSEYDRISEILPADSINDQQILKELNILKQKAAYPKESAIQNFLRQFIHHKEVESNADFNQFGYEKFQCKLIKIVFVMEEKEATIQNPDMIIIIGPKAVQIKNSNRTYDIPYQYITEFKFCNNFVLLKCNYGETPIIFGFTSEMSDTICHLIDAYISIIIPLLEEREDIQLRYLKENAVITDNLVAIPTSKQMGHPNPPIYNYDPTYSTDDIAKQLYTFFLIKPDDRQILYHNRINNHYQWLPNDDLFMLLNPSPTGQVYFIHDNPTIKVQTSDGLIIESSISLRNVVTSNVVYLLKALGKNFTTGFSIYPIQNNLPMRLDQTIPEQTRYYMELYVKRRFYIFPPSFFEEEESIYSLYDDCKLLFNDKTIKMTEERALDLALCAVYAENSTSTSFFHGFVPEDLAKFFPKSVLVNHNLGKKFFAYFKQMAPMTRFQASCKYIMTTIPIRGFGVEYHKCYYTDALHTYKTPNKEAIIHLGPFQIEVTNRSDYAFTEFSYDSIISYSIDPNDRYQILFVYHDNNKEEQHTLIKCNELEETNAIYEYVRQMFIYLAQVDLIRTPYDIISQLDDLLQKQPQNSLNDIEEEDTYDMYNQDDYLNLPEMEEVNYDDYDFQMNTYTEESAYDIQEFTNSYEEYQYIAAPENAFDYSTNTGYDSDYAWRTTEEGAKLDRATKLVNHIENDCILVRDQLDTIGYQDLIDRLQVTENFIDTLQRTVNSAEYTSAINLINTKMEDLRLTLSKFEGNQGDMPFYTDQLKRQFKDIEDSLQVLKAIIEKEKNQKIIENPPIDDPLVRNTIDVSRGLEELAISVGQNLQELQAKQQSDVINAAHVMSERLTAIACAYNKTNDPQFIEVNIRPALHEATIMMKKIKKMGVTDKSADDLLRLITAIDQMIVKTEESRNKVAHLMYFGDPQAIVASMSGFFMISSSLQHFKENESIDKYTKELIISTVDRIAESKKIINEQMLIMKKDPLNAIARHKIYYSILNSQDMTKQVISLISAKGINVVKENNTLNYIDTAIKAISTINIIPANISNVIGNINLLLGQNDKVKSDILKANCSQVEMNIIAETMTILRDIQFNVEQHQIELERNFLNGDILKLGQAQLLRIRSQYSKLKVVIEALEKATNDPTYSIIYERLQLSMNQTLCEKCPSESIDNCTHLGSFIQAINDVAVFINVSYYYLSTYELKSKSILMPNLTKIQTTYIELIKIHKNLIETSYDAATIQQGISHLQRIDSTFDNINEISDNITETTNDPDFQRITLVAIRSVKISLEDLKNAPKSIFRIPPNQTEVQKLTQLLIDCQNKVDDQLKPFLTKQIEKLKHEKENPSDNFFRIAIRVLNTLTKQNDDKYSGLMDQVKFFVNYDKPVVEDVKKLAQTAIPAYQAFLDLLKKQPEQRPEYASWELIIKHDIEIIETYLNECDQFDYRSAFQIKESFTKLRNRLPYIPNELRTKLDQDTFAELAKALGSAHAVGDRIINCVRNLPSTGIINIDLSKFPIIKNEDELCDSFLFIIDQIAHLKTIIQQSLHTSQVADQVHTQKLINDIVSILSEFQSNTKVESEEIDFLNKVKTKLPFLENSINLISPIIGAEKLPTAMITVSQNVNLLLRYLTSPHMDVQTANQFNKEIKPLANNFQKTLKSCKENISEIIKEFELLINKTIQIDSLKLRRRQLLCDDLYLSSVSVLPQLFEVPNIDLVVDDILKIYEITSQYTSAKKTEIKFTDNLQNTKQLLQTEAIDQLITETNLFYMNIQQPGLVEKITEYSYLINDQQEGLPLYIIDSLNVFINHELLTNSDRVIASTNVNFNDRLNELIQISIIDTTRVATIISSFRNTLNIINQQISNSNLFNHLAVEQFDSLQHSLSHVDTNLLLRNKSFSASVIAFVSIQDFQSNLVYFLDLIKSISTIQPILIPIKDTLYDLHTWIYNLELSVISVFYACMDDLVCTCESKKENGMMSFIRKLTRFLLNKERLHIINHNDLQEVSKLFIEYQKSHTDTNLTFDKLLPLIHIWSNIDNEPPSILKVMSNLLLIEMLFDKYKMTSDKVIFSQIKSLVRSIQVDSSKFNELTQLGDSLFSHVNNFTQFESTLKQMLVKSRKLMEEQLNKNKLNALIDQAKNDLKLIIDKSCLTVANKAFDYLKVLVTHINDIKDVQPSIEFNYKEKQFIPIPSFGMMSYVLANKTQRLNDFVKTNKLLYGTMLSFLTRQKYSFKLLSLLFSFPEINELKMNIQNEDLEMGLMQINENMNNEQRLTKQQAFIQHKLLSDLIGTIPLIDMQSPELDFDNLCDFFDVVRENDSKIDIYHIDVKLNYYLGIIRLLSQLESLFLLLINASLFKYVQSYEGQQKVNEIISNNDILEYQRVVLELIENLDFPYILKQRLNDISYEKSLSIIKIIKHIIQMIISNQTNCLTINEFFIEQTKINKENPNELIFNSLLSIDLIDQAHQLIYDLSLKYVICTTLLNSAMNYFGRDGRYINNPYDVEITQQEEFILIDEIMQANMNEQEIDEYHAICQLNMLRSLLSVPISSRISTVVKYKPLHLIKNTSPNPSLQSFVTFDSVIQWTSHLTDASLMLAYIPSVSNSLTSTDDDINEYLNKLHNSPSDISEFAKEDFINSIEEELVDSDKLKENIPSIILQSQLLKQSSLLLLSNTKYANINVNISDIKDNYLLLLKLTTIYDVLDKFEDFSNQYDENFNQIEKHLDLLKSKDDSYFYNYNNDEELFKSIKEMTEKERLSEKKLIIYISEAIYQSKQKVTSISTLKLDKEITELHRIDFNQYQQIVLADRILTQILKKDSFSFKGDHAQFKFTEADQFSMLVRIMLSKSPIEIQNDDFISFCNQIVYLLITQSDIQKVQIGQLDFTIQNLSESLAIKKLLTKFAYSVHSLIYLFSTYSQLPIDEVQTILESESKMALDLLKSQMLNTSQQTENIKEITEIIPQLISTLIRSLSQFSKTDQDSMLNEALQILPKIENILVNTEEKHFRLNLIDLATSISKINCVITNDSEKDIKENAITDIVEIINSRNKKEIEVFNYDLIQIESLYNAENTRKKNLDFLKAISENMQSVKSLAAESYSNNSFSDELMNKTEPILKILTDALVKEIRNPYKISEEITSMNRTEENLNEMHNVINVSSNLVIDSRLSNDLIMREINKIIASFFEALATATKIFSIQKVQSTSLFEDFTLLLPAVTKSIRYLSDLGQELQQKQCTSISQTSIKRAIRPFKRILNSLLDLIEDIKMKNIKQENENETPQLIEKKLNFLNEIVLELNYSLLTVSAKTYSQINDVFIEMAKKAKKYDIDNLNKAYNEVLAMNVDKNVGLQFVSIYQDFISIVTKFNDNVNRNLNGEDLPIKFIYDSFCQLAIEVSKTVSQSMRLTDIKVEVPDIENASRLPKFYDLPTLKSDENRKKFQENVTTFINNLSKSQKEFDNFKSISSNTKNNKEITDSMLSLISASNSMLYDLLVVTSTARTFEYQTTFSNIVSQFSNGLSSLLKSLKNRLLLRGDWQETEKTFDIMSQSIQQAITTSKEASSKADQEDKTHDAKVMKINATLKNLTETENSITKQNQDIEKVHQDDLQNMDIDWSIQMMNIGRSLVSGVSKVVLFEKGNTKSNIDPILKFADSINNQVKEISKTISAVINKTNKSIEEDVVRIMTTISELGKDFQKEKLDSKEENIMKDGITAICRNAQSLAEMAQSASSAKSMAMEKKRVVAESQRLKSKEKLLKRLDIESLVIRARILLERAEKQLAEMQ